uniref:Uncharacterized protein n=1 Tax=Lepeophtheirus salmonis TaxID=72036 RepID=A0A0K2TZ87_LEPSM
MLFQLCLRTVRTLILYVLNLLLKKLLHFLRDTVSICNILLLVNNFWA